MPQTPSGAPSPGLDPVYATFWVRFWAQAVDALVFFSVAYPPMRLWYGPAYSDGLVAGPIDLLVMWVLPVVAIVLLWTRFGATPGKMLFSLRIVDLETGGRPSLRRSTARCLAYLPSVLAVFAGFIAVVFDDRRQAWHDRLARTVVVDDLGTRTRPEATSGNWHADAGQRDHAPPSEGFLRATRIAAAVFAAYLAIATVWQLGLPYVPSSRGVSYLGPWMSPTELVLNRAGHLGLLLAALVSVLLIVRSWARLEARLAVFGLLLVLLPTAFLADLGLPELVKSAIDWASVAIGMAALWRFALVFPRPLTHQDFPRNWQPPGPLQRLLRRTADVARPGKLLVVAERNGAAGWGPDRIGPFVRPLPLDPRFVWGVVLTVGVVCFSGEALGHGRRATIVLLITGLWLSLHIVGLLRRSYRRAEPDERRRILWIAHGATLWIAIPLTLTSLGFAGGVVGDLMGSEVEISRATGYLAAFTVRYLAQVILPAALAMAILYGGAFDPEFLIRRTILYGTVGVATLLIFAGVEYLFEEQVTRLVTLPAQWSGWVAAISSAAAFGPLQTAVRKRTDQLFQSLAEVGPELDVPTRF